MTAPQPDPAGLLREEIFSLVAQSELDRAIKRLLDFAHEFGRGQRNDAVTISSAYHRLRLLDRQGTIAADELQVEYSKISSRILDLTMAIDGQIGSGPESPRARISHPDLRLVPGGPVAAPALTLVGPTTPPGPAPAARPTLEDARREWRQRKQQEQSERETDRQSLAFTCQKVSLRYGRSGKDFVLSDITLDVRAGEITAIAGVNGVGKTTLLRIIAGELRPTGGTLAYPMLDSGGLDWRAIRDQIGYVQQAPPQWSGTLGDNLRVHAAFSGMRGPDIEEELGFVLHRLGLQAYVDATWNQISGGYKMRFELARVLIGQSGLLILDEPLAPLDILSQQTFLRDLRDLANSLRHPLPIVLSSQHLYEIEAIADQIVFLDGGKAVYCGDPADVGKDRLHNVVELTGPSNLEQASLWLERVKGAQVDEFGTRFVVTVPRTVPPGQILEEILRAGGTVSYFRDVSRSTRLLFEAHRRDM